MRGWTLELSAISILAWSAASCGYPPLPAASDGGSDACVGMQCNVTSCATQGMPPTTITGTVFAPNGNLPLYGITVYVPNTDPGPIPQGVQCNACRAGLPGHPIAQTTTDDMGRFALTNVPDGPSIPVVITSGKWRRQIAVANVAPCQSRALAVVDTMLPRSRDDLTPNTTGIDMPRIAISTGAADALECLIRRFGIADKEITTDAQGGSIHLFSNLQTASPGVKAFDAGFAGGTGAFSDSSTLWGSATAPGKLQNYDMVILSCEGAQNGATKPQAAMDHLKTYADLGGRVLMSHWHNIWLEGSTLDATGAKPAVWPGIAMFSDSGTTPAFTDDTIDETTPKGAAFASWMLGVTGSPAGKRGDVPITAGTAKQTCTMIDGARAERWVYWQNGTSQLPQNFLFTTPNEAPAGQRCGKVAFSDMHVSVGPMNGNYPTSCGPQTTLAPQEKALAFMLVDLFSCVP